MCDTRRVVLDGCVIFFVFSDTLRNALGIRDDQLPPYIYQMRNLGYPPGHLRAAEMATSGLTMFGKDGRGKNGKDILPYHYN